MTCLIVTIDTEEEGLWGGRYRATGNTVENLRGIPRFQAFCREHGVRPTYLVDAPVVESDEGVAILREAAEDDGAEIGAHLHPWCNPPLAGDARENDGDPHESYLCNLPADVQAAKLDWLTETIERRVGRRPTSFRAGRYGLDMIGARLLADRGYEVDSSVLPFTDYSRQGGPDFSQAPYVPYFLDGDRLTHPHESGWLLEVPASVGYHRPPFDRADDRRRRASRLPRKFRAVGILDRLGIARRIKFSPEQADGGRLRQLMHAFVQIQAPALVLMFHSTSLVPGFSPYVKNDLELEEFYRRMEAVFDFAREQRLSHDTLTGFARAYVAARTSSGGANRSDAERVSPV